jgi:hypothetical protein
MTTDGGVLDDRELADLLRRIATIVTAAPADGSVDRTVQAGALAAVLCDTADRLTTAGPFDGDRAELARRLEAADHPAALAVARRVVLAELGRTAAPQWSLFR